MSPRGKKWGKTTIHGILTNETYTGTLVWGRHTRINSDLPPVRVENLWEPIVDKETFSKVQAILKERGPTQMHPRRTSSPYLLSGLAPCGYGDKALVCQEAKSGKFSYYMCGSLLKQGAGACPAP